MDEMRFSNAPGLGIPWLWQLPPTHPLHSAGVWHDAVYHIRAGDPLDAPEFYILSQADKDLAAYYARKKSSKPADDEFLRRCLNLAGNDKILRVEAKAFRFLARKFWGWWRWNQIKN